MAKKLPLAKIEDKPAPTRDQLEKVIAKKLPALVDTAAAIAQRVIEYVELAGLAQDQAERAEVTTADQAGSAAEVLKGISQRIKDIGLTRLDYTRPLDARKKDITALFDRAIDTLTAAQTTLQNKARAWQIKERARLAAEAAQAQQQREEDAAELAAETFALGDEAGAQQILDDAAALPVEVEKPRATGMYGARLGERDKHTGEVTDTASFLKWLVATAKPGSPLVDSIQFGQRELNTLARLVNEGEIMAPAGFKATKDTNPSVR